MDLRKRSAFTLKALRKKNTGWALGCAVWCLLNSGHAQAFCRTRACDPRKEVCTRDATGCITAGPFLHWPNACTSFSVNQAASPKLGISIFTADNAVSDALSKWLAVDCGSGVHPSLELRHYGPVSCGVHVYDQEGPNANVWMFADDEWRSFGDSHTLALTSVSYGAETGEIFDADVEINSANNVITATDVGVRMDLESIVTHEAGHFLGLEHSADPEATMWADYSPGNTRMRDLSADDIAAICEAYPAGRKVVDSSCEPRRGFTKQCYEEVVAPNAGCSTTAHVSRRSLPQDRSRGLIAGALLGVVLATRYRRHPGRPAA